MPITPAISPGLWRPDRPAPPTEAVPFERCLAEAREAGFDAVEQAAWFPDDPAELKARLDDKGVSLALMTVRGGLLELSLDEEKARLAPAMLLAHAMGAPPLGYAEATKAIDRRNDTPIARRLILRRDDLRRYGEKLTRLADWLFGEGLTLAFRPRLGTIVQGEDEIETLLDNSDVSVRLALDAGDLAAQGSEPVALIAARQARLAALRLQAVDPEVREQFDPDSWSLADCWTKGLFLLPGDEPEREEEDEEPQPSLTEAILDALNKADWSGPLVLACDRDPPLPNPREAAERAREGFYAQLEL